MKTLEELKERAERERIIPKDEIRGLLEAGAVLSFMISGSIFYVYSSKYRLAQKTLNLDDAENGRRNYPVSHDSLISVLKLIADGAVLQELPPLVDIAVKEPVLPAFSVDRPVHDRPYALGEVWEILSAYPDDEYVFCASYSVIKRDTVFDVWFSDLQVVTSKIRGGIGIMTFHSREEFLSWGGELGNFELVKNSTNQAPEKPREYSMGEVWQAVAVERKTLKIVFDAGIEAVMGTVFKMCEHGLAEYPENSSLFALSFASEEEFISAWGCAARAIEVKE